MIGPELWTTWDDWYEEAIGAWAMTGPWETTGTRTPAEAAAKMHETINYKFKIINKINKLIHFTLILGKLNCFVLKLTSLNILKWFWFLFFCFEIILNTLCLRL